MIRHKKSRDFGFRISAWITLQALVVVQILPPYARAEELRPTLEGSAQSGLEEKLARPSGGFATRVERTTPDGVQIAKRIVGEQVGETVWDAAANTFGPPQNVKRESADQVERVAGWAAEGLKWLLEHPLPVISRVWDRLGDRKIPVQFLANHAMTMDFTDQDAAVRLDVTVAAELDAPEYAEGRRLLYAVGMFHEAALAAGFTSREAIHLTLSLTQRMSDAEQKTLRSILRSPTIDHGNTWALFFEDTAHPEFAGVDTLTLEEQLDTEVLLDVRGKIKEVRAHRERWVSWLMGQLQIDLPYDRIAFRKAMEVFKQNVEAGRQDAYEVIRRFDPAVEQANADRMSQLAREGWLPDDLPTPTLLAGRASRAFDNQAMLFANAGYILKTKEVVEAGRLLHQAAQGKELMEQLRKLVESAPRASKEELGKAVKRVGDLLAHLGPGADRVRQLIFEPGKVLPSTQASGALQQLRESLENFLTEASRAIEQAKEQVVGESAEGIRRRPVSAQATRELAGVFRKAQAAVSDFSGKQGDLSNLMDEFRTALLQAESYAAAYSVLLQRPSATGSINFEANELEEKPEQEEVLRKLIRLGGQNLYMSPTYDWVAEATDIIEAAPLFIYERTITVDGHMLTVFEVDQEALEQTIRQMADYWAKNIDQTMDSEHAALAREIVANAAPTLRGEGFRQQVAVVAAWLEREFDRRIDNVEKLIEKRWREKKFIDRVDALREVVAKDPRHVLAQAQSAAGELKAETERFAPIALARRRPLPAFHLLTTEAPGLVEGFIQTVLDEEMALRNVVRAKKLEEKVRQRMQAYAARIQTLGQKVIREFGYEPIVEKYEAQGLSREQAVRQVIGDHLPIQQELAKLAVLAEMEEVEPGTEAKVEQILRNKVARVPLEQKAWTLVREHNRNEPDFSEQSDLYRQEMEDTLRWLARQQVLDELDAAHPGFHLKDRVKRWYRDHSALAQTTARRETIAAEGLNGLMMDPRYAYSSGVVAETQEGNLRPTGTRKRYHLIYAPSRVNLGKGERKSVEVWPQWVGVTDPPAAAHAKRFYALINFNPQIRMIKEAENLKVSENQWTAMVRAIRNVQAYFVDRLGFGDIEDLAWQFDQRDGLTGAALKQGESYQAGPTAGYCIPKDLLFKLFVATLQDDKKLSLVGIPKHLHAGVIDMMVKLAVKEKEFGSVMDWEDWAAQQLLSEAALKAQFRSTKDAKEAADILAPYIEVTGGVPVFQLTKILQLLALAGVPSPLLARAQALHSSLWSNWAERKLTLPAEEVNRSLVFSFAREIVEAAKEAQALNPEADIVSETLLRVHFYGTYKGDENYPSPPDVRFAWVMRAFMILAGFGKEVALSLDEEGQILARLSWEGFRPESKDPEDAVVTQYLAKQFGAEAAVVERLKAAFPPHTTVGDITITVVPGVSSDDLLGFSSETKNLLGDVAEQVKALLQAKGISPSQMQANAALHRDFPFDWVPLTDLSADEQKVLQKAVGGNIHPLVLKLRGPGTDFLTDLQGQDVAVFSVTHPQIMQLNPAHLRDRMLVGRPHSALTALDVVAQGRHRVWFDREVMLWYAAGRGVDAKGEPITDWEQRDSKGRKAVYRAFGFGREEYRPLLGTDLRGEVARQELRAREIYRAMEQVANASDAVLSRAVQNLRARYEEWLVPEHLSTEAGLAIQYEQQMLLNRRWKPSDAVIREALVDMSTRLAVDQFGEVHWLATGGVFLLNGTPMERRGQVLAIIRKAQQRMQQPEAVTAAVAEEDPRVALLIQPGLTVDTIRQAERQGESFSVKASEVIAEKAVQRRKGLALEAARLAGLKARQEGFKSVKPVVTLDQVPLAVEAAREQMGQTAAGGTAVQRHAGAVMGITAQVFRRLALEFIPEAEGERQKVLDQIEKLTQGRELNAAAWKAFGGSYEDHGILARLFELAGAAHREEALGAMELLYMTLALDKTSDFLALAPEDVDERLLLRALASFYAETIDDHFYEYNPWALDPKRGPAFQEFYGDLGILKPERAEELYRISWERHRALYRYVQQLVFSRSGARTLSAAERQALFGEVTLGVAPAQDTLRVQAIGAGAPGHYERFWRAYNQFREMAFIRNDGFEMPVVFGEMDPNHPKILDARRRVNFAFLSMVGRTHYSRALMEAGKLGENIFITRDGKMATPASAKGEVLQISDAHFWLPESQYGQALVTYKGMSPEEAVRQVRADRESGRLTHKGIRVAARFSQPVTIGSVVPHHHHYLADRIWAAGYPGTDKSPGVYEMSYDKSLYPGMYNPAEKTGVFLPPEIDWYRAESERLGETEAKKAIAVFLAAFVREYGIIVVKGAEESGARNFKRFDFVDEQGRLLQAEEMPRHLEKAAEFIYQVSTGQNVAIQRAIIVTPISWMNPEGVKAFVERQIRDHSVVVNLERHPKSWVYGTLRGIFSAGVPKGREDLYNPATWTASHRIALASLQVATNVGRQGTLEMLTPDRIRSQFSEIFIRDFEEAGRKAMAATARAGKKYWDDVYVPTYKKKRGGVAPREFDAAGTPYWWPRYLMLDFLPEPVWGRDGKEVPGARVIDVIPGDPKKGTEARFMLRDREGNVFEGQLLRFIFWLLEPNVGIGLWPNYWKREEVREKAAAKKEGRDMNWSNIGVSDRIVLSNYLSAGEAFLNATFGPDYFGPNEPPHGDGPDEPSPLPPPAVPVDERPVGDRTDGEHRMSPPVEVLQTPSAADLKNLLSHASTFAVVTGKTTLMNHHLTPWVVAAQGQAVNVVGVYEGWLTPEGKAKRIMAPDPAGNRLLEFDLADPVSLNHAFIVELPQSVEVRKHQELTEKLQGAGISVVNPAGESQKKADDKRWLRESRKVPVPQAISVSKNTQQHLAGILAIAASSSPSGIVIQPRADTTEGQGVQWFAKEDSKAQLAYLTALLKLGDAMVSAYRGNVTTQGRSVVFRFNVAVGEVTSASTVVAPIGEKIASLGRKGTTELLGEVLNSLEGPNGPVAITQKVWDRLKGTAVQAANAVGLPVLGIDLVLEVDEAGNVQGVVLEANARPGLHIFGERVTFPPDDTEHPVRSAPAAPAGEAFWKSIGISKTGAEENAITLTEWQQILADPARSGFWERLKERYGEDEGVLAERLSAYTLLISGAIHSGFDPRQKIVVVVASPGRDRVFMGHTDSPGLGGPTINVATEKEILAVLQATGDGQIYIRNADPSYAEASFPLEEIREVAKKYKDRAALFEAKREWDPGRWDSYVRGALAFMVAQLPDVDQKIGTSGIRLFVASVGARALPATGGVSSSSALTGTISVGMNTLFKLGLSLEQLAEVDYGEYLEGKTAGAGDKTAQLNAQRGQVVVVGSFPEQPLGTVDFPEGLTVLMAESPIPRLSSADGLAWLRRNNPERADEIYAWAKDDILQRFGSRAYVRAVQDLRQALWDSELSGSVGLTGEERDAVLRALENGFLRELTAGGKIEQELPALAGWENRQLRYRLIYRLLKLLPEQEKVESLSLSVRKAALYGLAELERGSAYLRELQAAVEAEKQNNNSAKRDHLTRVLDLVRWAQDGDRATVDHRNSFKETSWASDPRNDVSDAAIDQYIAGEAQLMAIPGGFERSIADLDEMADEVDRRFEGKAAMRIAAAGMGGTMAIHALTEVVPKLKEWLEAAGWKVRDARAGAPTQVIVPPRLLPQPAVEGFHLIGSMVVTKKAVRIEGKAVQLPNGSWLDATGGTILLGEGTIIGPHSQIYSGSILLPVTDETGKTHPVRVYGAQIGDPEKPGPVVIWGGTDIRIGAFVRPNSILGPFAHIGPGSEAKATVWMGAGPDKNDSALAHRGYGGNLVGIPVYLDGTPLDDAWHAQLLERLAALRFGRVVSQEVEKTTEAGPESRPRLNLVMDLDGKQIPVSVRGINFGDEAGVSNFKSVSGGRKAVGVISAGTVAGVTAKVQTPVFVGPDSLIDNGAMANSLQAAQPQTYVRPVGTTPDKAFRPGAVADLQGKSKGVDEARLFLANLRVLQTLARVSVAGLQHAKDPLQQAALKAEIQALKGHFDEINAYTAKELELLGGTSDADQVPALAKQADALRAGWPGILKAAAGAEEWAAPVFAEQWAQSTHAAMKLIQSFSGIRAVLGPEVVLPVTAPLPDTELSAEHRLIFAWYGYRFAKGQIQKFLAAEPQRKEFLFALSRDPRPSGQAVIEAQIRGMKVAAKELGVEARFANGEVLPTPFAEGLVRMTGAQGGVISTASHNPLQWNGVKYPTAAVEPAQNGQPALVQSGILLPAAQMASIVREFRDDWALKVGQDPSFADSFRRRLNEVDSTTGVKLIPPGGVLMHMVAEARMMWGLEDHEAFLRFQDRAARVKVVLDPNGGAAGGFYAEFLRSFGLEVVEINNAEGRPQHLIEPVREGLKSAAQKMQAERADFGVVFDYDADRGNTLLRDRVTGEVVEPTPWAVATMNVAMALTRAKRIQEQRGDARTLAVVVHDAPSQRIKEVANLFGAKLEVVEVGEVNVLQKMRELERQGYKVVIGTEIAGGGTVFRGDHPFFQGDTSRNGAMTALFLATTEMDPEIGRTWLRLRNEKAPANVDRVPVPEGEGQEPGLVDILKSLPGEQGTGDWHFVTRMETPAEKEGTRGEVPEGMTVPFKQAVERLLYERFWPLLRDEGLSMRDGSTVKFTSFQKVMHVETAESPAYAADDPAGAGVGEFGKGGWSLQMEASDGKKAELWFRGSLTEGMLRAAADAQGRHAAEVSRKLLDLYKKDWYIAALRQARGIAAGAREKIDLPPGATTRSLIIFTPETVMQGIRVLTLFRPATGEHLQIAAIVGDDLQEQKALEELKAAGLTLARPIVNLKQRGWNLEEGIVELQTGAWAAQMDTFVIRTLRELRDMARFLKVPSMSERSWKEWLILQFGTEA